METTTGITPVTLSFTVNAGPQRAFEVFTERFHSWWPTSHHVGKEDPVEIVLEPHGGGRWFERAADGTECNWGTVLAWEPPHRLLLAWQLNGRWEYEPDLDRASEVEVRFVAEAEGRTRVEFSHGRLERHGTDGTGIRSAVSDAEGGWPMLLRHYADAADAPA